MLLRGIRTGRPAGSEQSVEMIERLTGCDLATRKAGRPHKRPPCEISIVSPEWPCIASATGVSPWVSTSGIVDVNVTAPVVDLPNSVNDC